MAITIDNYPNNFQSFNEDLWFVVSSSNVANSGFKYIFDVYINSTLVVRVKSFPQPTTNKGIFNASTIIRNYWNTYFQPATTKTAFNYIGDGNRLNYVVKFGEEYGGTSYTNLAEQDTDAYAYYPSVLNGGGAFDGTWYDNYLGFPITKRSDKNFTTTLNDNRLFLTLQNLEINTPRDWKLSAKRYNSGATTTISGSGFTSVNDMVVFDISPAALNQYFGSSFITSATNKYEVYIDEDIAGTQYTAYVEILCDSRYPNIPIHFLNSFGGYDTMNFNLVNRESRSAEKKSYEEIEWQYRSGDMTRFNQYNVFYGGAKQFNTAQTISYKLTSDWLNVTDYTWLRDLIMSPEVYMEQNGYFIPVTIGTSNWAEKKRYADKMYNLELDINLGTKEYSQFR